MSNKFLCRLSVLELKIPPPIVGILVASSMWLCMRYLPSLNFFWPWHKAFAALSASVGLAFDLAGLVGFILARTTVNPLKPEKNSLLVTSGIHKWSRNPMYVGLLLMLTGWAAYLSNAFAIVLLPIFILYMNRFQIMPEERVLASRFWDEFMTYRQSVRRWL